MPNNNNANIWMQAAAGASQGAMALGLQRLGVNYDYRKQFGQQRKLSELQLEMESRLMDIQNQKQFEMWQKTGPTGYKAELLKAGLNPALMYGMSGGGGQTVGGGMPSANTGTAPDPNTRSANVMGIGLQGAMLEAQIENIKADTKNKLADATKTSGVDTEEAQTRVVLNKQDVKNKEALEALTKAETNIANIQGAVNEQTKDAAINRIIYEARSAEHFMNMARYNDYVASKTMKENIEIVQQQALKTAAEVLLIKSEKTKQY